MRYLITMWKTERNKMFGSGEEEQVALWFDPEFKPEPIQEFTTYGNAFKEWFNTKFKRNKI